MATIQLGMEAVPGRAPNCLGMIAAEPILIVAPKPPRRPTKLLFPTNIRTGLTMLRAAHRLRATAPTLREARKLLKAVRRDPAAYDERLGQATSIN